MTDTPSPGAGADARVQGSPAALAAVSITHLATPRPLSSAEADAIFGAAPASPVFIDASFVKPSLTALVRWAVTLLAMWLVQHGTLSKGLAAQLIPIGVGVVLAVGTLAWSVSQKWFASLRVKLAALTDPKRVMLK